MNARLFAALILAACGAPVEDVPAPISATPACVAPAETGTAYPLTVITFDGSAEKEVHSAAVQIIGPVIARARVRNAVGNDARDITQLFPFIVACDGTYLGTSTAFSLGAADKPGEWQELEAPVDLSTHPGAAQAVLAISPLHAPDGQQLVDVEDFRLETAGAP